ncbi:MAG: nucleotide exchange factor GrpE [Anaerolineae bacterium]|nr:nucleotide exchange factor GrpE [Anaerolineae bacterium]
MENEERKEEILETETVGEKMGEAYSAEEESTAEIPSVAEEVPEPDEITHLKAQLAEVEQKAAEYLDGWQRTQASFANYRKRMDNDRDSWRVNAIATLIMRLLPVVDDFERAFGAIPEAVQEAAWVDGIALIQRKLLQVLEAEDVKPIPLEVGDAFDPLYHQAIYYQETTDCEDGQVLIETQRGYTMKDRVIRPSMVVVAKAPAPASEQTESNIAVSDTVPKVDETPDEQSMG